MAVIRIRRTLPLAALSMGTLVVQAAARHARRSHGNAGRALAMQVFQTLVFVAAFYFMFDLIGLQGSAIRGDFVLYIMSGVFLFMCHVKAVGAVANADGPTSTMMKHAPMNGVVAVAAAALSSLYVSVLSMVVVLLGVHVAWHPVEIHDMGGAAGMVLLAWASGVAVGLPLYALKPWAPDLSDIVKTVYSRVNMIASGKMFVVNLMPPGIRSLFDWNPIFHVIDQCRGFAFVNYSPMHTDWRYAVWVSAGLLVVGVMAEFRTRRQASLSWSAKR